MHKTVIKYLVAALGLYLALWAAVAVRVQFLDSASTSLVLQAAELGEKLAPMPSPTMKPLEQACAGKFAPGDARSILAYIAGMEPTRLPALPQTYTHVDRTLVGVRDARGLELTTRFMEDVKPSRFWNSFKRTADPTEWMARIERARRGNPEMREARYLVAARYANLTLPKTSGRSYDGGAGEWGARVLAFPSGTVLCEGRGRVRMKERVEASGRGADAQAARAAAASAVENLVPFVFTQSVVMTPLHEVCKAGGDALCTLTSYWVGSRRD